jgi:TRAP-type C4-dicarboxylate transport system substrate-binding protein
MRFPWRRLGAALALALPAAVFAQATLPLRVVGGLAGLNQFNRHEEPFWTQKLPALTGGRVSAEIVPFDRAGIRGQDMLRLMQLGVVPLGTALLSVSAAQDPLIGAPDLAGLNPDIRALRRSVAAFRPQLEKALATRYGIELLAVYTYPAQVVYCNRAFSGLADLAGRRVRVSSAAQSDLVEALGGTPVPTGFAEILPNLKSRNIECAITGTMSGNTVGLHEATTHLHTMALNWGVAVFGANAASFRALPLDVQTLLRRELPRLEQAIWDESDHETGEGVACNSGSAACLSGRKGSMVVVAPTPADEARRREIFAATVLPRWVQRCGAACADVWNQTLGPASGFKAVAR